MSPHPDSHRSEQIHRKNCNDTHRAGTKRRDSGGQADGDGKNNLSDKRRAAERGIIETSR